MGSVGHCASNVRLLLLDIASSVYVPMVRYCCVAGGGVVVMVVVVWMVQSAASYPPPLHEYGHGDTWLRELRNGTRERSERSGLKGTRAGLSYTRKLVVVVVDTIYRLWLMRVSGCRGPQGLAGLLLLLLAQYLSLSLPLFLSLSHHTVCVCG